MEPRVAATDEHAKTTRRGQTRRYVFKEFDYGLLQQARRAFLREVHQFRPQLLEELWREVLPLWIGAGRPARFDWGDAWKRDRRDRAEYDFRTALDSWAQRNNLSLEWVQSEAVAAMHIWTAPRVPQQCSGVLNADVRAIGWGSWMIGRMGTLPEPLPVPLTWDVVVESEAEFYARVDRYVMAMRRIAEEAGGRLEPRDPPTRNLDWLARRVVLLQSPEEIAGVWRAAPELRSAETALARDPDNKELQNTVGRLKRPSAQAEHIRIRVRKLAASLGIPFPRLRPGRRRKQSV